LEIVFTNQSILGRYFITELSPLSSDIIIFLTITQTTIHSYVYNLLTLWWQSDNVVMECQSSLQMKTIHQTLQLPFYRIL